MATKSKLEDRIDQMEQRLRQLRVRKQQVEARQRVLQSRQSRRADTRRKILVGAVVLGQIERGEWDEAILQQWLARALSRAEDRALFGL